MTRVSIATIKGWSQEHAERGNRASHANANRSPYCWCGEPRYLKYSVCRQHYKERLKAWRQRSLAPRCPNCKTRFSKVKYDGLCAECHHIGKRRVVVREQDAPAPKSEHGRRATEFLTNITAIPPGEPTVCPHCGEAVAERRMLWRSESRGGHSCRGRNA